MSEPKWTPIPGFDGYAATDDGKILSIASNWRGYGVRELSIEVVGGYPKVRVIRRGRRVKQPVHKLVCLAFRGLPLSPSYEVRHIDGNPMNSASSNLAWGTRKENADDRTAHGRTVRGERINTAKLTPEDVKRIRREYSFRGKMGNDGPALSRQLGVSAKTIQLICRGEIWKHV